MRFRRLELGRYGGFADRAFDFGDGGPDLHLVVGPNEAGKSTALQAIGDLLFGIGVQTPQAWRYDYQQLRLRAVLEHDGATLDVTRRKGSRDTLLKPDGTPYGVDPLTPLLAGIDRAAFERMFGLDHLKLREGGDAILKGRDDAARITLEAGTGVSHIGRELTKLQSAAEALFKPSGQNPPVNRLMRERQEALAEVRQESISDSAWSAAKQRRADAEGRRAALIAESAELDREQARLDRIGRARAPLARLSAAKCDIAVLGALPNLPTDAAERLAQARAERRTARELEARHRADLVRADQMVVGVSAPGAILNLRDRIEVLDERRPVIEKAATDLQRRLADLERVDAKIAAARAEAGLKADALLPSSGWRKRAAAHLDARGQLKVDTAAIVKRRAELARERDAIERELAKLGAPGTAVELERALVAMPADAVARLAAAKAEVDRKSVRATELLSELAPWRGDADALRVAELPGHGAVADARRAMDEARSEAATARKEAEAAEANAIRLKAKVDGMMLGGQLPTPDAVAAERATRDAVLADVRMRLTSERRDGDEAAGRLLADAMLRTDHIADRRDAEAARVAEHGLTLVALDEAQALGRAARDREQAQRADLAQVEGEWARSLAAIGFERPILPADFATWTSKRERALEAGRERDVVQAAYDILHGQIERVLDGIAAALRLAGIEPPADRAWLPDLAREHVEARAQAAARHERLTAGLAGNAASFAELETEAAASDVTRRELDAELARLVSEGGLLEGSDDAALFNAVEALDQIAGDLVARHGFAHQVDTMVRDECEFEAEVAAVQAELGRTGEGTAVDQVRALAAELHVAKRDEEALAQHAAERDRLSTELADVDRRVNAAQEIIDELLASAGVAGEDELDRVVAACARGAEFAAAAAQAEAELAGADNGAGLDALLGEVAGLDVEREAAARARIDARRPEVATEREEVGRALNAADDEANRAAGESAAADAQQRAVDTGAELAQAAEEHVQAAAAAAVLRWVVEKHRQTNQAPLIARAGTLFADVTGGAFTGLTVGYDAGDRPVILANRVDGTEVGVDGMSEGTRDQLYLALRLGSIDSRGAAGALPIICDDLLITADDDRAGALMRVLATASSRAQVIVFSHHEHLVDVAQQAVGEGGFVLHRIAAMRTSLAA